MSGYVVFVRFFPGYTESFPFQRFANLNDDDIKGAVDALRKEWWKDPANRRQVQVSRKETEERVREWNQAALARPGVNRSLPWQEAPEGAGAPALRTGTPSLEEVAVVAGWGTPMASEDLPYGISRRYPVALFKAKEDADAAAAALQERVAELARATWAQQTWSAEDGWLALANPRFGVVEEAQLSRATLATARERIQRVHGPAGEHQTLDEALLRFYLPKIGATLEQVRDAASAADGLGKNQPVDTAVLLPEDTTILVVLSQAGRALLFSEICRNAAGLVRKMATEKGHGAAQQAGLVTLSDTKIRERVPVLEEQGLVSRPPGANGLPTRRKGVGITEKGLARLKSTSSPAR